jgi:hypothetical protein
MKASCLPAVLALALGTGCYHYRFDLKAPSPAEGSSVTYEERVPTWLNGFVGTGHIDATRYCAQPLRTELKVTATDVLLSVATLLIYTPHTLSVTCEAPAGR